VADEGEIVEFMVRFGVADTLLRIHVNDGTGHCRVCSAGPQAGRTVWPCRLRVLAEKACIAAARGSRPGA
jgi:hypothetical protein